MPWSERGKVDLRFEFVKRYVGGEKLAKLCREYQISRPTGYLWVNRYEKTGRVEALYDRSSKPHHSPEKTGKVIEGEVVKLREKYGWGARKLQEILKQREGIELSESTIKRIFHRNNLIDLQDRFRPAVKRFERTEPNQLWQADFKGAMGKKNALCEPLSILDDHSRCVLGLHPVASKHTEVVAAAFQKTFISCGIPDALLIDHGTPWWSSSNRSGLTQFSVWLMNQDIKVIYSGFNHPQTQGKVERFHKTLDAAVRHKGSPESFSGWSKLLKSIQQEYNHIRPHESLDMKVPASRYEKSTRPFSYKLKPPEYSSHALVAKVDMHGSVRVNQRRFFVSEALCNQFVQLDQLEDSILVTYRRSHVRELNLKTGSSYPLPVSYSQL